MNFCDRDGLPFVVSIHYRLAALLFRRRFANRRKGPKSPLEDREILHESERRSTLPLLCVFNEIRSKGSGFKGSHPSSLHADVCRPCQGFEA